MTECQLIAAQVDASHRSKVEENFMFIIAGVQISLHYTLGPLVCPLLFHQADSKEDSRVGRYLNIHLLKTLSQFRNPTDSVTDIWFVEHLKS